MDLVYLLWEKTSYSIPYLMGVYDNREAAEVDAATNSDRWYVTVWTLDSEPVCTDD